MTQSEIERLKQLLGLDRLGFFHEETIEAIETREEYLALIEKAIDSLDIWGK